MNNSVLNAIRDRRSHRAYSSEQVTKEQLDAILAAGLQAPSAVNRQPWFYSAVQNKQLLEQMRVEARDNLLSGEARNNPRFQNPDYSVFCGAPTVIFISTPTHADNRYGNIDCGIAVENMALAAQGLGLGSVILGMPRECFAGAQKAAFERALSFPEGYAFAIAIGIGNATDDKPAHIMNGGKIAYIL